MAGIQTGVAMKIEGLSTMNARIAALQREFGVNQVQAGKMVMRALHDAARPITAEAKRLAPVLRDPVRNPHRRPGELRSGIVQHTSRDEYGTVYVRVRTRGYIFAEGADSRRNPKSARRAGNPNYWWLQEFGTSQAPAQPFLRPAFERMKFTALEAFRKSLGRGIEVVTQKLSAIRRAA